jgi:hypothetical protein
MHCSPNTLAVETFFSGVGSSAAQTIVRPSGPVVPWPQPCAWVTIYVCAEDPSVHVSGCSTMTKIATETVRRFLVQEGSIGVVDRAGVTRMLYPALPPEYLDLAQTADRLWYNRTWHSREEFLQLCTECRIEIQGKPPFESGDAEPTPTTCAALAL